MRASIAASVSSVPMLDVLDVGLLAGLLAPVVGEAPGLQCAAAAVHGLAARTEQQAGHQVQRRVADVIHLAGGVVEGALQLVPGLPVEDRRPLTGAEDLAVLEQSDAALIGGQVGTDTGDVGISQDRAQRRAGHRRAGGGGEALGVPLDAEGAQAHGPVDRVPGRGAQGIGLALDDRGAVGLVAEHSSATRLRFARRGAVPVGGADALALVRALLLGDGAENGGDQHGVRRAGIDALTGDGMHGDAAGLHPVDQVQQVAGAPGESVDAVDVDPVDAALCDRLAQGVEAGTDDAGVGRDVVVGEDLDDLVLVEFCESAALRLLSLDADALAALVEADPRVDRRPRRGGGRGHVTP
ncbi:MAG: hypothetical protein QM809_18260 [Gordonia sp. (in: high G+C Gram-positive bacteria)]